MLCLPAMTTIRIWDHGILIFLPGFLVFLLSLFIAFLQEDILQREKFVWVMMGLLVFIVVLCLVLQRRRKSISFLWIRPSPWFRISWEQRLLFRKRMLSSRYPCGIL